MRLRNVKAQGRFSGAQLVISSFGATAQNGGSVTGTGRFTFNGIAGVGMDLSLQADDAALLERDDIAATVAWLALEAPYITGQILAVDGGRSLSFPGG